MEAFKTEGVVPDVIDNLPPAVLQLTWAETCLSPGGRMWPRDVRSPPSVSYDAEPDSYYTLICNDPDAPSRADPKFGEFHHWLVTNVPGCRIEDGDERTAYIGSGAPKGTGLHRYVFLLYKQPSGKIDFSDVDKIPNSSAEGRRKHSARKFAASHSLELVAGNFFLAEYDESVPDLHRQLGFTK
ncbi:protein D2-like [Mya arenaria]|uniref:protein D2-like n=1 Tax=Mya arenaria TaxID=6604 RepID=UPI0022E44F49|nr:protein D2-like [Mya arenaria]